MGRRETTDERKPKKMNGEARKEFIYGRIRGRIGGCRCVEWGWWMLLVCFYVRICPVVAQPSKGSASEDYIRIYQKFFAPQKNGRCPMYPHCSAYGMQLYAQYPFLKATGRLADRLMRCSHDRDMYVFAAIKGRGRLLDMLSADSTRLYDRQWAEHPHAVDVWQRGDASDSYVFINHLINKEYYREALLEIEREELLGKGHTSRLWADRLLCLRALGAYEDGIYLYETQCRPAIKRRPEVGIQAALLYYSTANYDSVSAVLGSLEEITLSGEAERVAILQGLVAARKGTYGEATDRLCGGAVSISSYQQKVNADVINALQTFRPKKTAVAGLLGVVPGAGYWYAGHRGSALTALLVNSLLAYATYTSVRSENYGVAGLCGFLGVSFYIGNISGSMRSVRRYNARKKEKLFKQLEQNNGVLIN